MKILKLYLDPMKATFIKNPNGRYTVYCEIPNKGVLRLYNISVNLYTEAVLDEENADFCDFFPYRKKRPIRDFIKRIKQGFYNT